MARKGAVKTVPITLHLTPEQVEMLLEQLLSGERMDWMDDPRILQLLEQRDEKVAAEVQQGKFVTLEALQQRWSGKVKRRRRKVTG